MIATTSFSIALSSIAIGLSDLASQQAGVVLERWTELGRVGSNREWMDAYGRLLLANRMNPLKADYSADLGRLLEWRAWRMVQDQHAHAMLRMRADRWYVEAIMRRPTWGFAWAHLAENRFLQNRLDHVFLTTLEQAVALAPWEPKVQLKVAWMGAATWDRLPVQTKALVEENLRRALQLDEHTAEVMRLAVQYEQLDLILPMLHTQRQLDTLKMIQAQTAGR